MTIGGTLDWQRMHFQILTDGEKASAVRRLRLTGMSLDAIAEATGLPLAQIERVLMPFDLLPGDADL